MSPSPTALQRDELWRILVETVHALPMYKNHKRYLEDVMIKEKADISPQELAVQLNIPLGEALVLLDEVRGVKPREGVTDAATGSSKPTDRTLLDFSR